MKSPKMLHEILQFVSRLFLCVSEVGNLNLDAPVTLNLMLALVINR